MSLIKNLVKEPEKMSKKDEDSDSDEVNKKERPIIKSATDLQRLKIEKLMKNPDKPVQIPDYAAREAKRNREIEPPSFVRNVMGSSAGAGSGEFHVYRHLRRKEYARQKGIQIKSLTEQLDYEYQEKLDENRRIAEEKTAKKRAKRLKKKQRAKEAKKSKPNTAQHKPDTSDEEASDNVEDGHEQTKETVKEEKDLIQIQLKTTAEPSNQSNSDQPIDKAVIEQLNTIDDPTKFVTNEQIGPKNDAVQEDLNKVD